MSPDIDDSPTRSSRTQASWGALVVIALLRLEERVEIPINGDTFKDLTATAITMAGTVFATVYGALLIWLTQGLALRRLLTSQQTLTAMHDEYNSWIGLGSALMSLYCQTRLRSALFPVICITSYLVEAAILHITIPAMFTLVVASRGRSEEASIIPAYPNAYNWLYPNDEVAPLLHTLFSDASSLLPYVGDLQPENTIGLAKSTLYGQLQSRDGEGTAIVNATTFNVTCGSLDGVEVVNDIVQNGDQVVWYNISHVYPDGSKQHNVAVNYIQPTNAMALGFAEEMASNRSFYLYGNFDIEDSAGTLLPNLTLSNRRGLPANMSLIGCDLYSYNHTVPVDVSSRVVDESAVPPLRASSIWSVWQPQSPVDPEALDLLDLWSTAVSTQCSTTYSLGGPGTKYLGFMEKYALYIVSTLGMELPGRTSLNPLRARVQLHEVENALSKLAASYFWSANQHNYHRGSQLGGQLTEYSQIWVYEPVQRLHLNLTSVAVGLVTSFFLMVTNVLLVRPRESRLKGAVDVLDSLGLLQIIWFLRDRPEVLDTVGRVENPTEDELRLAGLFAVQPKVHASDSPAFVLPHTSERTTPSYKWQGDFVFQPVPLHSPASDWGPSKSEMDEDTANSMISTTNAAGPTRAPRSQSSWSSFQAAAERFLTSLNNTISQVRFLRRLSYAMHGFLVGMHLALLIICVYHLEEEVVIPLSSSTFDDLTSTAITVSGTVFATVYGALLIWLTQRLALRRLLTSKQTLTAMHDEYNSWIGLGSALMTLYGQSRIRSALGSIACIASYLVNAAILHVTIPAMFTLQVGTYPHPADVSSIAAYPHVNGLLHTQTENSHDDASALARALFSDASSLLPYVVLLDSDKTVGLAQSTMYDQLVLNEGNNTVNVNATTFNVTCGSLNDFNVESQSIFMGDQIAFYNISHVYPNGTQQNNVKVKFILPNNTMALGFPGRASDDMGPATNRSFYLYGTFDVEDSAGTVLPNVTLPTKQGTPINMTILGCDLYAYNHTIDISVSTRLPLDGQIPNLSISSSLSAWQPQDPPAPGDLNILDLWSTAVSNQFQTTFTLGGADQDKLGFMEKYIISFLGLKLPGWSEIHASRGRVQLHNVENALSRLVASYFWSFNQVNNQDQYSIQRSTIKTVVVPEAVQRLHLNLTPVAVGLAVSLLLMATNALLVRPRESRTVGAVDVLDSLGLLQLIWFVRGRPEVLRRIGRVEHPNEDDLRLAGMFVIQPDVRASLCPPGGEAVLTLSPMSSEPSTPTYKWREEDTQLSPLPSPSTEWTPHKEYDEPGHY
ncbi:uncharacterized protein SCHCODRAFT_02662674 [Schizophyllum commune H4-8]|uniref:Uncharacterized protein n=1 Tax=Schizophyllum commune (strain H4-8 / FGSC 9210) TaxID=578458 RepID=D8PK81_SCHCM|nr:uncharacterized protein SCHCODRAFT_02662674 [Schizophyllum commune H4-8]KAI5897704.1 hypothetical protein SCHCODRAFT_02662674 [Schizophyllum commune H4-8]